MKQVAVIGAGQLGSRHLQGILKSRFEFDVHVVDPSRSSLELAETRAGEIEHYHKVYFTENISELPRELDLVIVVTNSDVRLEVLKELLSHAKINRLILEKVLFQSLPSFDEAQELLRGYGTKAYVNHARRMQSLYHGIQDILGEFKDEVFDIDYYGANWGLGCNGLHLSDAITFLLNDSIDYYDSKDLDPEIIESKRKGYIEFTGTLSGKTAKGHRFRITSRRTVEGKPTAISLVINSPSMRLSLMEGGKDAVVRVIRIEKGLELEEHSFPSMLFQSDLSKVIVEEALQGLPSMLTTYEEAMENHKSFISSLLSHLNHIHDEIHDRCPIT